MSLEKEDLDRLKEIFVTRQECGNDMEKLENKVSPLMIKLAVIEQQQKINNWLTALIAGGVITSLIKLFLGG